MSAIDCIMMYQKSKIFYLLWVLVFYTMEQKSKMERKQFLYPFEQQLKFCQLETEVEFLLQKMQYINRHLSLQNNNSALQVNYKREKEEIKHLQK